LVEQRARSHDKISILLSSDRFCVIASSFSFTRVTTRKYAVFQIIYAVNVWHQLLISKFSMSRFSSVDFMADVRRGPAPLLPSPLEKLQALAQSTKTHGKAEISQSQQPSGETARFSSNSPFAGSLQTPARSVPIPVTASVPASLRSLTPGLKFVSVVAGGPIDKLLRLVPKTDSPGASLTLSSSAPSTSSSHSSSMS
jgi:hypothetical protein